jgi:propanol-preferring alcohol dehydrogenase
VVLNRITIRGSIVGTRHDLDEALAFAADGKVRCHYTTRPLAEINEVFHDMRTGQIDGRIVLSI